MLPLAAQVPVQVPSESATVRGVLRDGAFVLEIDDPGNHAWMVQTSDTLGLWSDLTTHRVFNGRLSVPLALESGPRFFRLDSDAAGSVSSSAAAALLLPAVPFNYASPVLPPHLLTPVILAQDNTPAGNPTTDAGAKLGRVLFYDKRLSANQTVSCSSCHLAEHGFSDPRPFSVGFEGGLTGRNSMGLTNAKYYLRENFFWDERATTLEDQVLRPIQDAVEMGMTLDLLVTRLSAEPFYAELFTEAFGTPTVNSTRISRALAQFVRSIVSGNSKYDQGLPLGFTNFTAQENQGRNLFFGRGNCVACHGSDNFVPGNAIFNNGLENPYVDKGVGALTGLPQDEGLFKVPSLRNIELTGPYMHDGRFATLEQVVDFYNAGVVAHPNLSPPLRIPPGQPGAGQPRRLNLTNPEKAALVAFMKTLTDTAVTTDEKFQDPFRYGLED
jgi:cytochrome c peroxidase